MASNQERKIPVLTVLKNGAILKNIFLISEQPPQAPSSSLLHTNRSADTESSEDAFQEEDEILIAGRHPDCNIFLTHPSISRFHLQINSSPSLEKLSVTDLSSVHGTWVSDTKVEPGVSVELREGDTIRLGGSTRVYRLHWVPLSSAYDTDQPFVPEIDVAIAEEYEGSLPHIHQDYQNLQPAEGEEIHSSGLILEHIGAVFAVENLKSALKKEIPSAPLLPENVTWSAYEGGTSTNIDDEMETTGICSKPWCGVSMEFFHNVAQIMSEIVTEPRIVHGKSSRDTNFTEHELEEENLDKSSPAAGQMTDRLVFGSSAIDTEQALTAKKSSLPEEVASEVSMLNVDKQNQTSSPLCTMVSLPDMENGTNITIGQQVKEENLNYCCVSVPQPQPIVTRENNEDDAEYQRLTLLPDSTSKDMAKDDADQSPAVEKYESENISLSVGQHVKDENRNYCSISEPQPLVARGNNEDDAESSRLTLLSHSPSKDMVNDADNQNPPTEKYESDNISFYESGHSSFHVGEGLFKVEVKNNSETLQSSTTQALTELETSEDHSFLSEIQSKSNIVWSRRGKPACAIQVQTARSSGKVSSGSVNLQNKTMSRPLFSDTEDDGEEIFTPDKENVTPNTLLLRSLKRKEKLEEVKEVADVLSLSSAKIASRLNTTGEDTNLFSDKENITPDPLLMRSLKWTSKHGGAERTGNTLVTYSPNRVCKLNTELKVDVSALSHKANRQPKVLEERKSFPHSFGNLGQQEEAAERKSGRERLPFQSLPVSSDKTLSEAQVSDTRLRSSNSFASKMFEKGTQSLSDKSVASRSTWTMVVDTTSMLDKRSRKSLQLLQGLKGTRLIVPRIVVRELDYLKRRGSLFRRTTEASSALEWIEDCMMNTDWWIHVQSSMEVCRTVAPTPPATPQSQINGWEIASPRAEDHILDCALMFRKMKNTQQFVLLSNDITLKIKAMAEGVICETGEEFRDSLVNPFSERFLWADSSPRGQTWSFLDDVALREKYPLKKLSSKGEDAKGLKLILLHNSRYRKISSVR